MVPPDILKFLDLIFFKSDLLTSWGLSTQNLHSTRFHGPPDSIHRQRLHQRIFMYRSMHPMRRHRFTLLLLLFTNLLRFGWFMTVIWPPSMVYFRVLFYFSLSLSLSLYIYIYIYIGLFCCIFLPLFTIVIVFGSLWLNTHHKSHSLVTLILWHSYLKPLGLYLQKHWPRVLSFLVSILGYPALVVYFLSCCNLLHYL
jgi:hypothetical protein